MNSLTLQRLKLFNLLKIDKKSLHVKKNCCSAPLNDEEVMMLDRCFELIESLTETEKSSLYYIAGYVAKKEDLCAGEGQKWGLAPW